MRFAIFILSVIICSYLFPFTSDALPKGAVARLGKGAVGEGDRALAFSPDGATLAVATSVGVCLYDPSTLEFITILETNTSITSIDFSFDGNLLASGSSDNTIRMWDTKSGQELAPLTGHSGEGRVRSVAFSPDARLLASGSYDGTVIVWDMENHEKVAILSEHSSMVNSVAFSSDGSLLASGGRDNKARVWSVGDYKEVATLTGHSWFVSSVAFSPDGSLLATGSPDKTVKLWDVKEHKELITLTGHKDDVLSVTFSPDGSLLVSGSKDGELKLWDVESYEEIATLTGHSWVVFSVSLNHNGSLLASGSADGTVRLWDMDSQQELVAFTEHSYFVSSISFDTTAKLLASGGWERRVKLWNIDGSSEVAMLTEHSSSVGSVSFNSDSSILASGSYKEAKLWDMESDQVIAEFPGHLDWVSVAFSPDDSLLATGSGDNTAKLWDLRNYQELATFRHSDKVTSVSFSPDGRLLASGGKDSTVKLWDVRSFREVGTLTRPSMHVLSICFSPDSKLLAIGTADAPEMIRIWDIESFAEIATLMGHGSDVSSVVFSPDGSLLASGSSDTTAKLWDTESYQEIATLTGHLSYVRSVAFSPDGGLLASASDDGTILLWDVQPYTDGLVPIDDSLVLYLPFEEGQGNMTTDQSGNELAGQLERVVWSEEGKFGNCIRLGAYSYIEIPSVSELDITDQITMEAWIYPEVSQPDSNILGRRDPTNVGGYCVQWSSKFTGMPMVSTHLYIGNTWSNSETRGYQSISPELNQWHHVASVYDGESLRQYVDGILDAELSVSGNIGSVEAVFRVGYAQIGLPGIVGLVDEVAIYNRALSVDEIRADMSMGIIPYRAIGIPEVSVAIGEPSQVFYIGDPISVSINVKNVNNLAGFQFDVIFDPKILEVIRVEEGTLLSDIGATQWLEPSIDNAVGLVKSVACARMDKGGVYGSGTLAIITLRAIGVGQTHLRLRDLALSDPSANLIPVRIVDGIMTIIEHPFWDVNRDGRVDIRDIILVGQRFGEDIEEPVAPNPDVNGDGKVDVLDVVLICQHFGEIYSSTSATGDLWITGSPYLPVLTKIYNAMQDEPSLGPDFVAAKNLIYRLIHSVKVSETKVHQNYPNPFNPETWIPYQLASDSEVTIRIYSSAGQLIRILDLGYKGTGLYLTKDTAAYWDGTNEAGERVSNGIYFYNVKAGEYSTTKKMIAVQ